MLAQNERGVDGVLLECFHKTDSGSRLAKARGSAEKTNAFRGYSSKLRPNKIRRKNC